jgi:hypothetical protein
MVKETERDIAVVGEALLVDLAGESILVESRGLGSEGYHTSDSRKELGSEGYHTSDSRKKLGSEGSHTTVSRKED